MSTSVDGGARRRGRRHPGAGTRSALLEAARSEFATRGFEAATLRAIAAAAGTDPAMVHHWFGGKQGLFAAVMNVPVDLGPVVATVLAGPREHIGERLLRAYLDVWATHPEQMTGLVRSIATNEHAAAAMREFVGRALLNPLVERLHVDHARLRVELCGTQLIGLALGRFALKLDEVSRADAATLVAVVGPTLQHYLTGRLVPPPRRRA